MGSRARRLAGALPAAAGGLVAGHFLTYVFIAPAGPARAAILHHTGHGYFPRALAAGAAMAAIAMGTAAARGIAGRHASSAHPFKLRELTRAFAVVQVVGFILLETTERLVVRAPLDGLLRVLPVGLLVECVVALVAAWLVCAITSASRVVARSLSRRGRRRVGDSLALMRNWPRTFAPRLSVRLSSISLRGPPVTSSV